MKFYATFKANDAGEKVVFEADNLKDALYQAALHHTIGTSCTIDCKRPHAKYEPTVAQVCEAFHTFQQEMVRAMTRNPAGSPEQESAGNQATDNLQRKLAELGIAQHINWSQP